MLNRFRAQLLLGVLVLGGLVLPYASAQPPYVKIPGVVQPTSRSFQYQAAPYSGTRVSTTNQTVQKGSVQQSASRQVVPPTVTGLSPQQAGQAILKHLIAANGLRGDLVKTFKIESDTTLNAATDGQNLMFTSGLWNALNTADQRAFVISHELSHITLNHIPKTMGRQVGLGLLSRVLGSRATNSASPASVLAVQAAQVGLQLTDLKFSRDAEYEADARGMQLLKNAGYNPQGAVQAMEILANASKNGTPQFLRSHPLEKNRIDRLAANLR